MATNIEKLQAIIDNPDSSPEAVKLAQQQLDRLAAVGSAQVQMAATDDNGDATLKGLMDALQKALSSGKGGNVSASDLRDAIREELKKVKINEDDLSDSLKALIQSTKAVQLTVTQVSGLSTKYTGSAAMLDRKLTQLILSDTIAKNNVYLYGGAGTGKTYMAEEIARMLGWTAITLNCNQYTSPLDILGGQTIDGYQEGKVSQAWSNTIVNPDGSKTNVDGVVLILDELPKIDPNTAGILNEALAKVKDYRKDDSGNTIPPTIRNGRNQVLPLGNLLVVATGNVPLNTIDPDYEANFKQDLSLQDRFVGSTYKVYVDYKFEAENVMRGYAFIWIFATKLREAIMETSGASSQAFVSMRLMVNLKATYAVYRDFMNKFPKGTKLAPTAIKNPKTIIESLDTFFGLFKDATRQALLSKVNYDDFKQIVAEKNKMPFDPLAPNFDNSSELAEMKQMVQANEKLRENAI